MIFKLDKNQIKKFAAWKKTLDSNGYDSFGSRFMFTFVPSGIGNSIKVVDLATKQELDLTDYDYL